jgi:hypothetical protein
MASTDTSRAIALTKALAAICEFQHEADRISQTMDHVERLLVNDYAPQVAQVQIDSIRALVAKANNKLHVLEHLKHLHSTSQPVTKNQEQRTKN